MMRPTVNRVIGLRFPREVLLIGVAYGFYQVVRSVSADRALDALENAKLLVSAERALGIFSELNLQAAVLSWQGLVDFLSLWYFWGHFPFIVVIAVFTLFRRRGDYVWARNAIFAAGAIALVVYVTFPVAPPRLFPGAGFVDTLRDVFALQYEDSTVVNQYAAVPSMHQGFALIMGVAMYRMFGGRKGAALMLALPALMFISIVATGNHWFIDALLGLLVAAIGMKLAFLVERHGLPLPQPLRSFLSADPPPPPPGSAPPARPDAVSPAETSR
ncbi:MAG: PAP2 superfamily protein [Chloroflexi bacterium]|nr:MAG: PAP2 superfamily protein [Chloroflexota bacterium]